MRGAAARSRRSDGRTARRGSEGGRAGVEVRRLQGRRVCGERRSPRRGPRSRRRAPPSGAGAGGRDPPRGPRAGTGSRRPGAEGGVLRGQSPGRSRELLGARGGTAEPGEGVTAAVKPPAPRDGARGSPSAAVLRRPGSRWPRSRGSAGGALTWHLSPPGLRGLRRLGCRQHRPSRETRFTCPQARLSQAFAGGFRCLPSFPSRTNPRGPGVLGGPEHSRRCLDLKASPLRLCLVLCPSQPPASSLFPFGGVESLGRRRTQASPAGPAHRPPAPLAPGARTLAPAAGLRAAPGPSPAV